MGWRFCGYPLGRGDELIDVVPARRSIPSRSVEAIRAVRLYRDASLIQDVAGDKRRALSSEQVHVAFYWAMRASGVPVVKAKIRFAAVYHFGPQWAAAASTDPGAGCLAVGRYLTE